VGIGSRTRRQTTLAQKTPKTQKPAKIQRTQKTHSTNHSTECKFLVAEKELFSKVNFLKQKTNNIRTKRRNSNSDSRLTDSKTKRIMSLEKQFTKEITKYRESLTHTRNTLSEKNGKDYERKLKRLLKEKNSMNEKVEAQLISNFMFFFGRKLDCLKEETEGILETDDSEE